MNLRRGLMAQMAGNSNIKTVKCVLNDNVANTMALANEFLSALPAFSMACAFKDIDINSGTLSHNEIVEVSGLNNNFDAFFRYRNGSYSVAQKGSNWDAYAQAGDSFTIVYIP